MGVSLNSQTQSQSINQNVTFQWSDTQNGNNNNPATIRSITVSGTQYNTFVVPSSYELSRLGPDGNNPNGIILNSNEVVGSSASSNGGPNSPWNSAALAAFQSKNLNYYFTANPNGRNICKNFPATQNTDAQKQTLFYSPAIPSNADGILAVTERGGNNCFYIEMWGTPPGGGPTQKLGETFVRTNGDLRGGGFSSPDLGTPSDPTDDSDYWGSGREQDNGQTIAIALFELKSIAPLGSKISRIEFVAASRDHGDGKLFILQSYAVDQTETGCLDTPFSEDLDELNNVPEGSTYALNGGLNPSNAGTVTLSSDGIYNFTPAAGFLGEVTFEYDVTLPAPNTSVSDTGMVTLTYVAPPDAPQVSLSCNDDGTTNITVISPIGDEFEYSLDDINFTDSPVFGNLDEGVYTVYVRNIFSRCEISSEFDILIENINIVTPVDITPVDCFGDNSGSIDITVMGGTAPYTFEWSDTSGIIATTEDLSNVGAGTYFVTITDANGCTFTNSFEITEPENPLESSNNTTQINVLCFGEDNGSINLDVTGGTPPYSYSWNTGATTQDINNLTAGLYTVTVTGANGCELIEEIEITEPEPLEVDIDGEDILCNGVDTGSITSIVSGGTPPYTYSWSNGATSQNLENLSAGTYNVTVTDANGCTVADSATISEPSEALGVNISKMNATTSQGCSDGSATATPTGGTPPYTYQWSASADNQTTQTATGLDDQSHTVTVTDANDCIISQSVVIDCINTCDAVIAIANVKDVLCAGENTGIATVTANSAANPDALFTFTWNSGQVDTGVTSSTLANLSSGVYTVSVTIDNTVCLAVEQSVTITEPSSPVGVTISSTDETGPGLSNGTATANPSGGVAPYTYFWSNGETTQSISGLSPGNYDVTITDSNGCTATGTTTVNEGSCENLSISTSSSSVSCNGFSDGAATSVTTGGTGPFTYSWSNGATSQNISGVEAGSYIVTVTDTFTACTAQSTITVNEPSVLSSGIAVNNVLCFGESTGSLNLTVSGGTFPYTFAWSNGQTTEDLTGIPAGDYDVIITDANGCTITDSATILQPAAALTASVATTGENGTTSNDGTATVTPSGGTAPYSILWSNGETTDTITGLDSGDYTVTVTDANGCQFIENFTINTINQIPDAVDDNTTTPEDTAINITVLQNDTFGTDGPSNSAIIIISGPSNGTATVNDNNTPNDPTDDTIDYVPAPDFNGTDSFVYQIADSNGDVDNATVFITVTPETDVNPDGNPDTAATPEDTAVTIDVLDNDTYAGDYGTDFVISSLTEPTNGTVTIEDDGTVTYTPNDNFNGTDTFDYVVTVTNPDGTTSTETGSVIVTIDPVVDVVDDFETTNEDTPVTLNVLDNDLFAGDNFELTGTTDPANGTVTFLPDGTVTYTPGPNFNGEDQFDYTITVTNADGTTEEETATVFITVGPITDGNPDTASTPEDTAVTIDVLDNDTYAGNYGTDFVISSLTDPTNGTVTIEDDGTVTYTPNDNFNGTDTFDYVVTVTNPDGTTSEEVSTVVVTIDPVVDVVDDFETTNEDTPVTLNVLDNDLFAGDNFELTGTTDPANGTVTFLPDGTVTYTPGPNFNGEDQFDYTITVTNADGTTEEETATVFITVLGDNPEIQLEKDGVYEDTNGDGLVNIGDSIIYSFIVTNIGDVIISDIIITDPLVSVTGGPIDLAPGESDALSFSAIYALTQEDLDAGAVYNLATARGEEPGNDPNDPSDDITDESEDPTPVDPTDTPIDPDCPDCTVTPLDADPELTLLKDGMYEDTNGDGLVNVGDSILYTFTVSNTGNQTVTGIVITDPLVTVTGGPIDLAPGESDGTTFTAIYAITQADLDSGAVYNLATATGQDPDGEDVTDESEDPTPVDPSDTPIDPDCPECTVTPLDADPELTLLKDGMYEDTNGDGLVNVGDSILYTFTVSNTGNQTVTGIVITDPLVTVTGGPIDLAPGESDGTTFTAIYSITQADLDSGAVYNLATATGHDPDGEDVTDESEDPTPVDPTDTPIDPDCPDCTVTPLDADPELTLLKDGMYEDTNGDGLVNVGDSILYTFTVSNTGNQTVTGIVITDPLVTVTGGPIDLAPGESDGTTFTAIYAITQADLDSGAVYNLATATGQDPDGEDVTDESEDPTPVDPTDTPIDPDCPDCTVTPLDADPELTLLKDGMYEDTNGDGLVNVGDSILYTFTVSNTGNQTVTGIVITDPLVTVTGGPIDLAPGESDGTTFTAIYSITQADLDSGAVYNLATATGQDPDGEDVTDESEDPTPVDPSDTPIDPDCPDCTVTPLDADPELTLLKDGMYEDTNGDGLVNVGDSILYTFTVSNTGNQTVTGIVITDPLVTVTGGPIDLAPGESDGTTFTAIYAITQADLDSGAVYNLATATGQDPDGEDVTDESEDPTPVDPSDTPIDPDCPDCTVTPLDADPELTLLKDGMYEDTNGDGLVNVGDSILYTFTVSNTGNQTVTGIVITDPLVTVTGGPIDLAPGESDGTTFTAIYAITQADLDSGAVYNLATATGQDPDGEDVTDESEDPTPVDPTDTPIDPDCPECTVTPLDADPELTLLKDGMYEDTNGDGLVNVGDSILYTFTVSNTGNQTVTGIVITDPLVTVTGGPIDLAPGESDGTTFTAIYAITQADLDSGAVYNLATATGQDPDGEDVTDESEDPTPVDPSDTPIDPDCPDCTVTPLDADPELTLLKDGMYEDTNGDGLVNVGDSILYTFTVSNTGNQTVTGIVITDPLVTVTGGPIDLAPGESDGTTFTAIYAITQADLDSGAVYNLATATGQDPDGEDVTDESEDPTPVDPSDTPIDPDCPDCTVTPLDADPELTLLKDGMYEDTNGDGLVNVGDSILYTFTVSNTGNQTVTGIVITDPLVTVTGGPIDLAPGESDGTTFTAIYAITQADLDSGAVYNLATATGQDPDGEDVTDESEDPTPVDPTDTPIDPDCPDCTVTPLDNMPSIALIKTGVFTDENGDGFAQAGETIVYSFEVSNTGNVTITNIIITDPLVTVTGGPIDLAPGESDDTTFTAVYVITEEDVLNGQVENQALAIGQDPDGSDVTDESDDNSPLEDDITIIVFDQMGSIALEKTGEALDLDLDGFIEAGEIIQYSFTVTNTGPVTLTDITIEDPLVFVEGGPITLEPGASDSETFTATYIVTAADIEALVVINQATVTGFDPIDRPVTDLSDDPNDLTDVDPNGDGNPDDPTVIIIPGVENIQDLIIFNGISPDEDGVNDWFVIEGIENFPENTVQIFNRWGILLWSTEGYDNEIPEKRWNAISDARATVNQSNGVPDGTYYYIVQYQTPDGLRRKAGYLYVNR